jgi:hypothetical protein
MLESQVTKLLETGMLTNKHTHKFLNKLIRTESWREHYSGSAIEVMDNRVFIISPNSD